MQSDEATEEPVFVPGRRRPVRRHAPTVILGTILVGLVAVVMFFKPYRVSSGSMAPTATVGQRVLADHLRDRKWTPKVGQVVVFKAPGGAMPFADDECAVPRRPNTACVVPVPGRTAVSYVKRVVGAPGDRLRVEHGHVIRNGAPVREGYARTCEDEICNLAEFRVPTGAYFVMGDNRGDSSDSRFWGPVPRDQIIGRVFGSYWPPKRFGRL